MAKFLFITNSSNNPEQIREGTRDDWSCTKSVNPGDIALLYITGGTGITEEWVVESEPWRVGERHHRCKVRFSRKIDPPVTLQEIQERAPGWAAAQQNFRGYGAIAIPPEEYRRLRVNGDHATSSFSEEIAKLERAVQLSRNSSREDRLKRLQRAARIPSRIEVVHTVFKRNADVIAEVLERAAGRCELCGENAPFVRAKTGDPYLEVHHKVRLADGGEDVVENATALCPNCHRREHYA